VPVLNVVGEQKTKPTQHSVKGLRGLGLTPDILACRSTKPLEDNVKEKLAQFCHVPLEYIFTLYDVPNIWRIPLLLKDQKAHLAISKVLNLARYVLCLVLSFVFLLDLRLKWIGTDLELFMKQYS
jgi:CTP synthase